jgi:hypothetical protein
MMELENLKLKQQNELFMQMLTNQKLLATPNSSTTVTDTTNNLSNLSQKGSENTNTDLADSSLDLTRGNFYKSQKVLGSDHEDFLF